MSKLIGVVLVVALAGACFGVEPARRSSWKTRWIISVAALAAASLCDAHSSMGRMELNPLDLQTIRSAPVDQVVRCEECGRILVRAEGSAPEV